LPNQGILKVDKLGINFGGLVALEDIDFLLKKGEILGLIGPNGSGKTTLFNLITGIYKPSNGNIIFNDNDITILSPNEINKKGIARTFQNTRLFWNLSTLDNILLGMHRWESYSWMVSMFGGSYTSKRLKENIEESINILNYFSKELEDRMYQKVKDLSQADKKRIEICRSLASKPQLLLLDEPSAGMNPEETTKLMDDLSKIKIKKPDLSIILIEHDMKVIKGFTQRVIVFNHGLKIFEGPFEKASEDREVLKAYLGGEV
jgi:branched-chain amino acid transport system ATP-binding protein